MSARREVKRPRTFRRSDDGQKAKYNLSSVHAHRSFEVMVYMWQAEELCDLTLLVGSKSFRVHRVVLSACIPYLRAMLTSGMRESRQVGRSVDSPALIVLGPENEGVTLYSCSANARDQHECVRKVVLDPVDCVLVSCVVLSSSICVWLMMCNYTSWPRDCRLWDREACASTLVLRLSDTPHAENTWGRQPLPGLTKTKKMLKIRPDVQTHPSLHWSTHSQFPHYKHLDILFRCP